MWDWSSFFSGVTGVLLGASVLVASEHHADNRRQRQVAAVGEIGEATKSLLETYSKYPPVGHSMPPELVVVLTHTLNKVSKFSALTSRQDHALRLWLIRQFRVMFEATDAERAGDMMKISKVLSRYLAGDLKSSLMSRLADEQAMERMRREFRRMDDEATESP